MRTRVSQKGSAGPFASACAAIACIIGVFALGTWLFGEWRTIALGNRFIPMAPFTACLLILLSVATLLHGARPSSRSVSGLALAVTCVVFVLSLLAWMRSIFGYELPVEAWLTATQEKVGGIRVGRISPLTAFTLMLSSSYLLFTLAPLNRLRHWRQIASSLSVAVMVVAVVIIASYASGVPLLYGFGTIPMALLSAIAFSLLTAGMLSLSEFYPWLLMQFYGRDSVRTGRARLRQPMGGPVIVLLLLTLAVGIASATYLRYQLAASKRAIQRELATVADLKTEQIARWHKGRKNDVLSAFGSPFAISETSRILAGKGGALESAELLRWMEKLRISLGYRSIALYDSAGKPVLAAPPRLVPANAAHYCVSYYAKALRANEVIVSDLHRFEGYTAGDSAGIHMSILIPVRMRPESQGLAQGVWLLDIDPNDYLYPLIQSWPTPSVTAETLLVRREGNEVLFLNELRHRANTALKLRIPIDSTEPLPAAMAATGTKGFVEGIDYRGEPVVADVRPIPGTPWFMVAKVDSAEVYAPMRQRAFVAAMVVLILLGAASLAIGLIGRGQENRWLQRQLVVERERQALSDRFQNLMRQANDIIILTSKGWKIQEANERALDAYGYTLDELQKMTLADLSPHQAREKLAEVSAKALAQGNLLYETEQQRKDGSTFSVEISGRLITVAEDRYWMGFIRDISERKQAEEALRESEERYRELFARMIDGFAVHEIILDDSGSPVDYRFIEVNSAFERITGLKAKDITGRTVREVLPDTEPKWVKTYGEVVLTGEPVHFEEYSGGLGRHFEVSAYRSAPGQFACVVEDITERKRADERQRLSRETLELLNRPEDSMRTIARILNLLQSNIGIECAGIRLRENDDFPYYATNGFSEDFLLAERYLCERDKNGEIVRDIDGKPVLECMCGNVLCGRTDPLLPFFTEGESFWTNSTTDLLAGTTDEQRQAHTRNRCNGEGYESVALIPLRVGSEIMGLVQFNDSRRDRFTLDTIHFIEGLVASVGVALARRQTEDEIRKLNVELEHRVRQRTALLESANNELEAFSYSVSHDLRSPLRGIDGWSLALLEDFGDKLDEQAHVYIQKVRSETQRMGQLIDDLLLLARVTRADFTVAPVDLSSVAEMVAARLRESHPDRDITFSIQPGLSARGDGRLLEAAMTNLLDNAVKFTGQQERALIEIGRIDTDRGAAFFVRDNGAGFDMARAQKLFGAFQRMHRMSEFPGTGVGLATVQRIIHRHGGTVWADAHVNEGATFYFTIPDA